MSLLYKKTRAEILKDHKRNDYRQAVMMPLRDVKSENPHLGFVSAPCKLAGGS